MSAPASLTALIEAARAAACDARYQAAKTLPYKSHLSYREVEVVAGDGAGNRVDDPVFIPMSMLSAKTLRSAIASLRRNPQAVEISLQGGFDLWESFNEYMKRDEGYEYEPCVAQWDVEVPKELMA